MLNLSASKQTNRVLTAATPAAWLVLVLASLYGALHLSASETPLPPVQRVEAQAEAATPDSDTPAAPNTSVEEERRHLSLLGVDRWHLAGYRGRGIKIAVLDSGFRGYRSFLGHVLPARVRTRSFRRDGDLEAKDSQHGIWCAAVLHSLAPEAELLFANWEADEPATFLEAARWARAQGARIISCSLIMPSWSDGEGGGHVHETLARIVGLGKDPEDVLYFASAGNIAQRHWSGLFQDAGNGSHAWQRGEIANLLTPWGDDRVAVELCWQPGPNYNLIVREEVSGVLVERSPAQRGEPRTSAVIRFQPEAGKRYLVQVQRASGTPGAFHLAALGGTLRVATARGSVACPADGAEVIAVGAVDNAGRRAGYSSCGPNSRQPKPDLVAPVPFPGSWRARPFSGTSAAAPQAAALAALWWSRHPHWTADQVRDTLRRSARDVGPVGHDWETGYGVIGLPSVTLGDLPSRTVPALTRTSIAIDPLRR